MTTLFYNTARSIAFGFIIALSATPAFAAPGTLADTPLFVTNAVEPNVFFTLDDSGSMSWDMMFPDGTAGFTSSSGIPIIGVFFRYTWHENEVGWWAVVPPATYVHSDPAVTWDDNLWVMRNHNANKLYYNTSINYTPWKGRDSAGNPLYTEANPTKVLLDPNSPGSTTIDLTKHHWYFDYDDCWCWMKTSYIPSFFTWTDTNANGTIDGSDGHQLYEIKPSTSSYPSGRSYSAELQNFANWFQYYRTREFSAKAAIGSVINNADATRMGLDLFNAGHKKDSASMTNPANKRQLLSSFYGYISNGGTPARRTLNRVGNYFSKTNSSAPILNASQGGECQQNFNILMTDGFWNGRTPTSVGNADQSNTADGGFDGDQTESNDGGNYEDTQSDTLADVAMKFYETDLRSDLANKVPTKQGVDENNQQHLVTYTIAFGLTGTLDSTVANPLAPGFVWPNPYAGNLEKVDDLWHAAYNGRGKYLSAQNPAELEAALGASIADISERTATAAAASVTSAALTTESVVYLSEFNTNRWQGTIYAYGISQLNNGAALTNTPLWSAADLLNQRTSADRSILTYDKTNIKDGVPFRWSSIDNTMKSDLKTNALGGTDPDNIGQARLNYLRGSRNDEGGGNNFRTRATLLGDIVHSGPVYVAEPSLRWPDKAPFPTGSNAYSTFKAAQKNRSGTIYVGANDGMIHAFNGVSGEELLAYIPSYLASSGNQVGLHYLTQPNYGHQYYNDLTPTVSDVFINASGSAGWKTVLISGQRGGGRGYTALNITDPSLFADEANAAQIVLWEFSSRDDSDLGFSFSKPQIGMTNDHEWVAIFGNGYNSTGDGQAKLFIVKIAAGVDGTWSVSDYTKISTGVGTTSNPNGLSTPALADLDQNGTIDIAYAGDLQGNMWVFDLSSSSTGGWKLKYGASTPLFTTIGNRPITSKPALSFHPTITSDAANTPNIIVTFGTGQYLINSDKNSTYQNYFYGVWDKGSPNKTAANLVQQTFRSGFGSKRVLTQNPVDYTTKFGWYIPLTDVGERTVTNPIIRSNVVFFNSTVPTTDACSTGGYGYRFAVDLATGGTPDKPVIDITEDGKIDSADTTGTLHDVVSAEKFDRLLTDDTITQDFIINDKEITAILTAPSRRTGRISWQELLK